MANSESIIYLRREAIFNPADAFKILLNSDVKRRSTAAAHDPEEGEVYVYSIDIQPLDNYAWCNAGQHRLPKDKPTLVKTYYHTQLRDGKSRLYRDTYRLIDSADNHSILVHYRRRKRTKKMEGENLLLSHSTHQEVSFV